MEFLYGKQQIRDGVRGQESCWLLTNGLGGFSAQTILGSVSRNDHALLMACTQAPNHRWNVVHRLEEQVQVGEERAHLSSQTFPDGEETGWQHLDLVRVDGLPQWRYTLWGLSVEKELALAWEQNTAAVRYRISNRSGEDAELTVTPWMQFVPKGQDLDPGQAFRLDGQAVESRGLRLTIHTNGTLSPMPLRHQRLSYPYDACDGRRAQGLVAANCCITLAVPDGAEGELEIVFSLEKNHASAGEILAQARARRDRLEEQSGLHHPVARQLAWAADAFLVRRESTGGKTILAGYPFFEDWGRDTMIALPGCTLATGRQEDAKSILSTFMAYQRGGLMPNLFPEGGNEPMYNTVDAALLFVHCVWLYVQRTQDLEFLRQAWPVMEEIIRGYREGTDFGIHMDRDGLIAAGRGLDQVTWMDVRVGDILPTPRHGKPVEVNAYWYNALKIMEHLAGQAGTEGSGYAALAAQVWESFQRAFWMEERGYLRDVVSGTGADEQIRCNQIWAVSMPFSVLEPRQERAVVETVYRHLYTPVGLRTLSPRDPEFHPRYGGEQLQRDLAYHQGTVWPFPLGAYYLAYLKVHEYSPKARETVQAQLDALIPALAEGCAGQMPEIYDGGNPTASRGCFAQAWSVGELLRVYEALEGHETKYIDHRK